MKKLLIMILSLFTIFSLSACKGEDEIIEVDMFDIFKEVIDGYDVEDTNGTLVEAKQYLLGDVIHLQVVEQYFNRTAPLTGKTFYYERRVGPFSEDSRYVVTEFTTYYRDGQMITEIEDQPLTYEETSYEDYVDTEMLLKGLTKDNFVSYDIEIKDNIHTLTGELTIGSVRSIFGTDISMVESNEIMIVIDETSKRLINFVFFYTSEHTNTTFSFTPVYEVVDIVIPVEE